MLENNFFEGGHTYAIYPSIIKQTSKTGENKIRGSLRALLPLVF